MYMCVIGKKPKYSGSCGKLGCVPGFNRTAEDGSLIVGPLNDICLDNCLCRSANAISLWKWFPASCKLEPNMLYQCNATGGDPYSPELCLGGCMATTRDHTCRDCRDKTQDVSDLIQPLWSALSASKDINGLSKVILPNLISKPQGIKANLIIFKDDVNTTELRKTAGYAQLHLNMTLNILHRLNPQALQLPSGLQKQLEDFEEVVTELELCSSANVTYCPDVFDDYERNAAAAIRLLKSSPLPRDDIAVVEAAVAKLMGIIESNSQEELDEAAEDLNRILVDAKLNPALGTAVSGPLELIIITARDTLDCKNKLSGANRFNLITVDLADLCSAYMHRFKGETLWIAQNLERFRTNPTLGPLPLTKSIIPALTSVNDALITQAPDQGNTTCSLQSALLLIKDAIELSPLLSTAKAEVVTELTGDLRQVSNKLVGCAPEGVDTCEGPRKITRKFGLSASTAVARDVKAVADPSDAYLTAAEDVTVKLRDLTNLLNRKVPADVTDVCEALYRSVDVFEAQREVALLATEPLDMTTVGCE
ncbi:hypothetical protein BGX23_007706 [Mortierella sp. AD031]|nr:hypothetical protein BGX23_007706 [Mortierella sp. AD031]